MIKNEHSKDKLDIAEFQSELPYQIQLKLAKEIHDKVYKNIRFFNSKPIPFIAFIGPMLISMDF